MSNEELLVCLKEKLVGKRRFFIKSSFRPSRIIQAHRTLHHRNEFHKKDTKIKKCNSLYYSSALLVVCVLCYIENAQTSMDQKKSSKYSFIIQTYTMKVSILLFLSFDSTLLKCEFIKLKLTLQQPSVSLQKTITSH